MIATALQRTEEGAPATVGARGQWAGGVHDLRAPDTIPDDSSLQCGQHWLGGPDSVPATGAGVALHGVVPTWPGANRHTGTQAHRHTGGGEGSRHD